jgi:hypothetical protein
MIWCFRFEDTHGAGTWRGRRSVASTRRGLAALEACCLSTLAGRSCLGTDSEWATTCWTSWYPGAGRQQPSFRAGVESHYASFVCFEAPDSVTHAEVAAQVEDAYQRALRGNRSGEGHVRGPELRQRPRRRS